MWNLRPERHELWLISLSVLIIGICGNSISSFSNEAPSQNSGNKYEDISPHAATSGQEQILSVVLNPLDTPTSGPSSVVNEDFIKVQERLTYIRQHSTMTVDYHCGYGGLLGLELRITSPDDQQRVVFWKVWQCPGHATGPLSSKVVIDLPDEFAYRPSIDNPGSEWARLTVLRVWVVEASKVKGRRRDDYFQQALVKALYVVHLADPWERPARIRRECWRWPYNHLQKLPYVPTCTPEADSVKLVKFPLVLNGDHNGLNRQVTRFHDSQYEHSRLVFAKEPRFTLVMWLYVYDYCLTRMPLCSIMHRLDWNDTYYSPTIFVNRKGHLHVQIATADKRQYAFLTNDYVLPKNQWVRLTIVCQGAKFELISNHKLGDVPKKFRTWYRFGVKEMPYFDDTEGVYVLGGSELIPSFKGYIGEATIFRNRAIDVDKLPLPSAEHPMFTLELTRRHDKCRGYLDWIRYRIYQCHQILEDCVQKYSCPNSWRKVLLLWANDTSARQCKVYGGPVPRRYRYAGRLVRDWVLSQHRFTLEDIGKQLYADVMQIIEDEGLSQIHDVLQLLKQASCYGNHDASFVLAAILSKGVGVRSNETEAHAYLMYCALDQHRLCSMSLGNKHAFGLDGIPFDNEQAYTYYKFVGSATKGDRERHGEDDVFTEAVRLTDEVTMEQQTDEEGDLFVWFKHQAAQGVVDAQQNLGRLLFWGQQGVRRDLRQAAEYYRMGADLNDAQSLHDYGIVLLKGQGVTKNETLSKEYLKKAAEQGHAGAYNALGWFAIERDNKPDEALELFLKAYHKGQPDAAFNIGHMFVNGRMANRTVDRVRSYPYFLYAASRGQLEAATYVAMFDMRGLPTVKRNAFLAMDWARFVSEQNPKVGIVLSNGLKMYQRRNWDMALLYYTIAAESGVEVANFNLAYLCEEHKAAEGIIAQLEKECVYRHYNLSTMRWPHQVEPYAWIKMGDYHWFGCGGERDPVKAAEKYAKAVNRGDPHALYNLAFLLEEGAQLPTTIWQSIGVTRDIYLQRSSLLEELYSRCKESHKSEAFIPCTLSLYRVQLKHFWEKYHLFLTVCVSVGVVMAVVLVLPIVKNIMHGAPDDMDDV